MLIILKPTNDCNCRCVYCSASYSHQSSAGRMTAAVFEDILGKAVEYQRTRPGDRLQFLWHGGEPLLVKPDFYARVVELTESYGRESGVNISHIMQSNLHLLDADNAPVIARLLVKGALSSSFEVLDGVRLTKSPGRDYMKDFERGLKVAVDHGLLVNAVYVVHKRSLARWERVLSYVMDSPLRGLRLSPLEKLGRARGRVFDDLGITALEWGEFLWNSYSWLTGRPHKPVAPFEEWGLSRSPAMSGGSCAYKSCLDGILAFDFAGRAFGCGHFLDKQLFCYGNIRSRGFQALLDDSARQTVLNRKAFLSRTECAGCPVWDRCRAGCPMDGRHEDIIPYRRTAWCAGHKYFFERFDEASRRASSPDKKAASRVARRISPVRMKGPGRKGSRTEK
jgi:uncharacterized protein